MNYLRRATNAILGRGGEEGAAEEHKRPADAHDSSDEHDQPPPVSEEDMLNQCMPEELQEEMFCFTMGDCELSEISTNKSTGMQTKKCEFINSSIHITQMPFTLDGTAYQMPCVIVSNDDYDPDQDQKQEEKLPIAENLIFMRYQVTEEGDLVGHDEDGSQILKDRTKVGYCFYYPDLGEEGACFVIEADPESTPQQRSELQ